jgi:hypothetical protein
MTLKANETSVLPDEATYGIDLSIFNPSCAQLLQKMPKPEYWPSSWTIKTDGTVREMFTSIRQHVETAVASAKTTHELLAKAAADSTNPFTGAPAEPSRTFSTTVSSGGGAAQQKFGGGHCPTTAATNIQRTRQPNILSRPNAGWTRTPDGKAKAVQ